VPDRVDSPDNAGLPSGAIASAVPLIWGIGLCAAVTLVAVGIQAVEERVVGHPYVEAIVIAILLGIAIRAIWQLDRRWLMGVAFTAKQLLEVAVALLGASLTFSAIAASGFALLGAIVMVVIVALAASFGISRLLGLPTRLSILIACGNSICGNSAIAAVAPVIGASSDDIISSISFTAVLGVLVVLGLPLLIPLLHLSETQYGILAGMTVYAVPQVLAATAPISSSSTESASPWRICENSCITVNQKASIRSKRAETAITGAFSESQKAAPSILAPVSGSTITKRIPYLPKTFGRCRTSDG